MKKLKIVVVGGTYDVLRNEIRMLTVIAMDED